LYASSGGSTLGPGAQAPPNRGYAPKFSRTVDTVWSIDSQKKTVNFWCHQTSEFKAKMHKIRFPLGLHPDPAGGAYSGPPDSLPLFKGYTSKGREGKGRGRRMGHFCVSLCALASG